MGLFKKKPPDALVTKVIAIARLKEILPLEHRGYLSIYGSFVQSGLHPDGKRIRFMAGDMFIPRLVLAIRETSSGLMIEVEKYDPGDWEHALDRAYQKAEDIMGCIALYGPYFKDSEPYMKALLKDSPEGDSIERQIYDMPAAINLDLVRKVSEVNLEHYAEINANWQVHGRPRLQEFGTTFLTTLQRGCLVEYNELVKAFEQGLEPVRSVLTQNVAKAYSVGYMCGKGWISLEEQTHSISYFGECIAHGLCEVLPNSKAKGSAFFAALGIIAAVGAADARFK